MKTFKLIMEVRKTAIVEAINEEEAVELAHNDEVIWEEDEVTLQPEAHELKK